MYNDNKDSFPQRVLFPQLKRGKKSVADTSSLIVMEKIGLLVNMAHYSQLVIIPQVDKEFGLLPSAPFLRMQEVDESSGLAAPAESADFGVLATARAHQWYIFAEDRRILRKGEEYAIPVYDSLAACLYLLWLSVIDMDRCELAFESLKSTYKYDGGRIHEAQTEAQLIVKGL